MRSAWILFSVFAFTGGCDYKLKSVYQHATDRIRDALGGVAGTPCFRSFAGKPGRLLDKDCYKFGDRQRLSGVARQGFKSNQFYRGLTTAPKEGIEYPYELYFDLRQIDNRMNWISRRCAGNCIVYIEGVGRRTAVEGSYGHMGLFRHIVIFDSISNVRFLDHSNS